MNWNDSRFIHLYQTKLLQSAHNWPKSRKLSRRKPWPALGCNDTKKKQKHQVYFVCLSVSNCITPLSDACQTIPVKCEWRTHFISKNNHSSSADFITILLLRESKRIILGIIQPIAKLHFHLVYMYTLLELRVASGTKCSMKCFVGPKDGTAKTNSRLLECER